MADDPTPDDVRSARFRTVFRGVDGSQVAEYLDTLAAELDALTEEKERLEARLGEYADRDLRSEFDNLGREVSAVLQAAREAAESMRERASHDAGRWRSEAMAEAEGVRRDAKNDAEALRGDAWTTGSELLAQSMTEIKRLREESERELLTTMGEAEREAHRLTSSARREAEDLVRGASMDAEKITAEATKRRDGLIDQARRQASAAEERTRALEERREELLEELEKVRSTLGRLEGSLEERRDDLDLSATDSSSVRVVPTAAPNDIANWELGETVRVVSSFEPETPVPPPEPEAPVEEPTESVEPDPAPEPVSRPEAVSTAEDVAEDMAPEPSAPEALEVESSEMATEPASPPAPAGDEVGALFASLRGDTSQSAAEAEVPSSESEPELEPEPESKSPPPAVGEKASASVSDDRIEDRDSRLLPITNRALRGVKKAVTDAQNVALDTLRTDADWAPEATDLADAMRADLIGLWSESYSAGHTAAEEMVGSKLKRPDTPHSDAADDLGEALADAVSEALVAAGDGQRERQSSTSRVFRAWRTDEAERRVRELAHRGYHQGMADSATDADVVWAAAGTPCSACADAASDPRSSLPPVHTGCECTIVVS